MAQKWVYLFEEVSEAEKYAGSWEGVRGLLGGKGSGLADMARAGVPVPAGFTVTTEACNAFRKTGAFPEGMWDQALEALREVEKQTGKKFGDPSNPLLVSCRSGAKFSMPGMMNTILNIGVNDETAAGLAKLTGNPRFVFDAYRRLVEMFGTTVFNLDDEIFEHPMAEYKARKGYKSDTEMTAEDWQALVPTFKESFKKHVGSDFPQDVYKQLELATKAVFESWNGKRARDYRKATNISDDLGTAVNIVTMVFGDMGFDFSGDEIPGDDPARGGLPRSGAGARPHAEGLRDLHQRRAAPDVHERHLLVAHRPRLFRRQPEGHERDRLRRRLPVRGLRAAVVEAAHQGDGELRARCRPQGLPRLGEQEGPPPLLRRGPRRSHASNGDDMVAQDMHLHVRVLEDHLEHIGDRQQPGEVILLHDRQMADAVGLHEPARGHHRVLG